MTSILNETAMPFVKSESAPRESSRVQLRVDPEHHCLELMERAICHLRHADVRISLEADRVVLTGSVDSWHSKQRVQECLRTASGRRQIQNDLTVDQLKF